MTLGLPSGLLPLLSWMGTYLVHSTLLIGGLWILLQGRAPRSATLRAAGWQLVLLAGLVTSLVQVLVWPQAGWQFAVTTLASPGGEIAQLTSDAGEAVPVARWPSHWPSHWPSPSPLALTWAWGMVSLTVASVAWGVTRWARQWLAFRALQTECVPVTEGRAWEVLEELRLRLAGAPEIDLVTTDGLCEPAAWALPRWTILLPERAERELDDATLQALLAHELGHLARHDSVWLGVARLLGACLAIQPLNHLARREWQRAAECLGDDWAVRMTGNPLALARCLATVAGWRTEPTVPQVALAALGTRSDLTERVERLLQHNPQPVTDSARRWSHATLAGGMLAAVTLVGWVPGLSLQPQRPERSRGASASLAPAMVFEQSTTNLATNFSGDRGVGRALAAGGTPFPGSLPMVAADFPRGTDFREEAAADLEAALVCQVFEQIWVGATRTVREQTVVVLSARGDVRWIQTTSAAWSLPPVTPDFPRVDRRAL